MNPSDAIVRLVKAGYPEAEIAKAVGTAQSTINRIKHGASPSFDVGQALIRLAKRAQPRHGRSDQEVA